jgi:hypothetical protein
MKSVFCVVRYRLPAKAGHSSMILPLHWHK